MVIDNDNPIDDHMGIAQELQEWPIAKLLPKKDLERLSDFISEEMVQRE